MLQIMKEDLALKKKSMTTDESNKSADANAMVKIADSMQMLSHAIMTGFNHKGIVTNSNLVTWMEVVFLTLSPATVVPPQPQR